MIRCELRSTSMWLLLPALGVLGCEPVEPRRFEDVGRDAANADGGAPDVPSFADGGLDAPLDAGRADDAAASALVLGNPLRCGAAGSMRIALVNTGSTTWSAPDVALLAIDADPFAAVTRIELAASVAPGETATFVAPYTAPSTPGPYLTDWQMVRGTARFGEVVRGAIAVNCPGMDAIPLASAVVHASPPGVAGWPITAEITALDVAPTGGVGNGGIVPTFTRQEGAGRWPDVPFLGGSETIYYTLWIALNIGGTWHVAGAQQYWYEPGLRMCGIPSGWTSNLFYDVGRWGEMTGYPIAPGELVGVLVAAGDHRSRTDTDGSTVLERSPLVLLPFPGDIATTMSF